MNRAAIAISVSLFLLGLLLGQLLPTRVVAAQNQSEGQGDWVMQQAKVNAHFDAYLFNTRTGEVFYLEERSKTSVKPKP
jgi:hypothetical protein